MKKTVELKAKTLLPTKYGKFTTYVYCGLTDGEEHVAMVKGEVSSGEPVLVRLHSECLTGETFHSLKCDCGWQLDEALRRIGDEGGVLLYLRQEGRGIGLINKIKAYALQEEGLDTVEANEQLGFDADLRHYDVGAEILCELGVKKIRLMTNNPKKIEELNINGLEIVETIHLQGKANKYNKGYLQTKKEKMGHDLEL